MRSGRSSSSSTHTGSRVPGSFARASRFAHSMTRRLGGTAGRVRPSAWAPATLSADRICGLLYSWNEPAATRSLGRYFPCALSVERFVVQGSGSSARAMLFMLRRGTPSESSSSRPYSLRCTRRRNKPRSARSPSGVSETAREFLLRRSHARSKSRRRSAAPRAPPK